MGLQASLRALAVVALIGTVGLANARDAGTNNGPAPWVEGAEETDARTGRPVRIASFSFKSASLERVSALIDEEGRRGVDLVVLPETWRGTSLVEEMTGETITAMSRLAKQHHTYIVSPIYRTAGDKRLNTAVVIDRSGKVVATYDKIFPYWNEFDMQPKARPGTEDATVMNADFGRIGLATCYDAKFPEVFQRLRERGAELVVWTSAYSGYTELQAFSLLHHYAIVTATLTGDALAYDITGKLLVDRKDPGDVTVSRVTLDLDRTIYHYNFNLEKRDKLLKEHAADVALDVDMPREEWFVLAAKRPGVSVKALAREYGLEELRAYKDRSRVGIDAIRGFSWSGKYGGYPGQPPGGDER